MPRKQFRHLKQARIDTLFADLDGVSLAITPAIPTAIYGWTWECNSEGIIIACSSEVEQALGIPSTQFIGKGLSKFQLAEGASKQLEDALHGPFPLSIEVAYINSSYQFVPATIHILQGSPASDSNGSSLGWHGFSQILSRSYSHRLDKNPTLDKFASTPKISSELLPVSGKNEIRALPLTDLSNGVFGLQVSQDPQQFSHTTDFLPSIGNEILTQGNQIIQNGSEKHPTTIPGWASLLLEILDENPDRRWSSEERALVTQVTDQLTLAFENARLFQQNLTLLEEVERDRARFSDLYNRAPNCYFSIDPNGLFIEINDTGLAMLGYSRDDLVGHKLITDILSSDSLSNYSTNLPTLHQLGRIENLELDFIRKDGSILAGLVDASAFYDENRIFQYSRTILRDVTRVRQLEDRQKQLIRAIDATADLVLVTERNGTIIFANPALEAITGYQREEVLGHTPRILRSGKQEPEFYTKMWNTILDGQIWRGELINRRKNGTLYNAQLTISPISNEQGQVSQFVAVQRDITVQKRAEAERERLLVETEILYRASAELNSAQSYVDILNTIRHHTIAGRKSQSVYLAIFDRPWTEEVVPQWIEFLARWTKGTSMLQDQRIPLRSFTSLLKIMGPEAPLVIDDVESDARLDNFVKNLFSKKFGAVCSLFIPLIASNRWIGFINANYSSRMMFHDQEIRRLMGIAGQAAVAFQNIRLLEETRIRNEELATINTIIGTASHSHDVISMLDEILDRVLQVVMFKAGLISVPDPKTGNLRLIAQRNLPNSLLSHFYAKGLDNTLCDWVYKHGDVLHIIDFQDGAPIDVSALLNLGISSYLGVPLTSKNKILGTLCIFGDQPRIAQRANISLMQAIGQQVGVAVENALLFEQTEQALSLTEQLYAASSALNAVHSYSDILEVVRKYTLLGLPSSLDVTLFLFGPPDTSGHSIDWLSPLARWVATDGWQSDHARIPVSQVGSIRDYWSGENVLIVADPCKDERFDQLSRAYFLGNYEPGGILFAPVTIAGEWAGMISSVFREEIIYNDIDIRILKSLLGQAGVALQSIRLLNETQRKAEQLQTAAKIARDTSATLALEELLSSAVNLICQGFNYYHSSIFLIDDENNNAIVRASTGSAGEEMKRNKHSLPVASKSVIGYVTAHGQPLVLNNVLEESIHRPNPLLPNTRAESGIPLKIGSRVIGALDVQSTEINAFTPDDISVLQTLADQIAIAVENARSFEITQLAVDEMRKADQLKSQFLSNMSHELRTPLNSIIGFSRVILKGIDGPVTEIQQQDLTAIYNSGQHLLTLINDILDLSKIEAGKMELSIEDDVNINDIIKSVLSTVAGLVKDKSLEIKREVPQDLPRLKVDPLKIRQVLINLFSNAAKFTEKGSITIHAQVQYGENSCPELLLQITDTGPGISSEDQKKLFLPFSQVDSSPTRKTGGSGLGLSICRHLVEMHGGKIGVVSKEGEGSTFYFTLPINGFTKSLASNLIPGTETDKVILAVDDELQIIHIYERYLKPLGYRIFGITNPFQTVEFATQLHPIAILLDDMMPELTGWQVFDQIKNSPQVSKIPVIFCAIRDEQEKAYQVGAAGYLLKPVLEHDLVQVISRIGIAANQRRILVIESSPDVENIISRKFSEIPIFAVSYARTGHQALAILRASPIDIILIDLALPDIDGYTLLETFQSDPYLAPIPIILLTKSEDDKHQNHDLIQHVISFLDIGNLSIDILIQEIDKALQAISTMHSGE